MKRVLKGTMVSLVLGLTLFSRGVDVKAEDNVKRFVIPDDVTEIPAYYFNDLQDVEEIVLGENVSEVYLGAFDNCPNVKKLVINKNCEEIDEYALSGLTGLESIEVEKGNEEFVVKDNALFTKSMKTLIAYPRMCKKNKTFTVPEKTKQVFDTAFTNNAYIKKMIIKGDARDGQFWYCEKYACRGMKSLTTVIFKSKQIKHQLGFRDCKKLKKVVLANGTKTIKQRQFAGCKNLVSLNFPRSIKTAYENSFDGCKKLKIPKRIKTIGKKNRFIIIDEMGEKELIAYTGIKKAVVKVPDGVGRINGAFEDNKYIKKIILPDSVKEIWAFSFHNLKNLKVVEYSKNVKFVEDCAFVNCPKYRIVKRKK